MSEGGPKNFPEEVANHVCAYFEQHLKDEVAIADEMRALGKRKDNFQMKACPCCHIFYDASPAHALATLKGGIFCQRRCRVVLACGRRFCHFDRPAMIAKYECMCLPKMINLKHYMHNTVCNNCAKVCRFHGCAQRLCDQCSKQCPSCLKEYCEAHVVKRICIPCMEEEADVYRKKWPNHMLKEEEK
jgi:hypothetical protein